MKLKIILLSLLVNFLSNGFSQVQDTLLRPIDTQWEYIVVSFGKTLFDIPEKTLAYKELGIDTGNESISLQTNFDILGRFGWELVSITGAIGGDQQAIFKRKYEKQRSENEYGWILTGKEIYIKDLQDILERRTKIEEERKRRMEEYLKKPSLINIDEQQRIQQRMEQRKLLENIYKSKWESLELDKISTFNFQETGTHDFKILIVIDVDLTEKFLFNGNYYHGDQVVPYLESLAENYKFVHPLTAKYPTIKIVFTGHIRYDGREQRINSYTTEYFGVSNKWNTF